MDKKDSQRKMCDCNQGRMPCSCKVPPAVAEYEDAEGRPVSILAEHDLLAAINTQPDPWQASGADWCSSIHQNPDAKAWADFFVAVFPGQATKHELMIGWFANAMMAMHDHLKAKPGVVVLPERMTAKDFLRYHDESWREELASVCNELLDEVARLNSSPVSAGDRMCTHPEGCTYCAWCGFKVSAGDDAEQAAFEAWLVRVCPSGDADSVRAQWLESSDYEDFCDQAYDAEAERLTAEALGVGAGINPNATSIDDIFLTESAGGVDERAAFDQIHACCSASAATSTFAGNRVPDPQARAATPAPAPAVEPAHSDVSVPRELLLRTLYNENPSDADFLAMRALLNGGQE
jgi:hypothetical protein